MTPRAIAAGDAQTIGPIPRNSDFINKKTLVAAVTAMFAAVPVSPAEAGCYRMGLSGYHWYYSCFGPCFLYPHSRVRDTAIAGIAEGISIC